MVVAKTGRCGIGMDSEEPRLSYVRALSMTGFHRIAVWEWGVRNPSTVPVMCVHGLTRQARDFDMLARHLARAGRNVICPDIVGRGHSDWLSDPSHYNLAQYAADMNTVLAWHGGDAFDWVGTSLGGLIGMVLAAHPGAPIRRMLLNDVGPYIAARALRRIGAYMSSTLPIFATLEAAEQHVRGILAPFGDLTDPQWRHLAVHSFRRTPDGLAWVSRHDPAICRSYRQWQFVSVDMWSTWNRIHCPTLVLRGADSDFLPPNVVSRMRTSGPRAMALEFAGCGHTPALMDARQIEPVTEFLETAHLVRTR